MLELQIITDFGDQAVVLPLIIGIAAIFIISGWPHGAFVWTAVTGITLGSVLLLKLGFIACGHLLPGWGLNSPSGHTAAASAAYGGLLGLFMRSLTGRIWWTLPGSLLVALVIGVSRVILGLHTGLEVLAGGLIGIGGAMAFVAFAGVPPTTMRLRRVAQVALLIMVLFHGLRMPAEAAIKTVATDLWPLSVCRTTAF